ncbi:MAG: prepilin-type N-terminal cleavage/methylation domain-containing protein, partial [Armatimonadota bacterium]
MNAFFSRRRGKAGFTLIELLVVIAIIAILAAILF